MYGPEVVRGICQELATVEDDSRCAELIALLRTGADGRRRRAKCTHEVSADRFLRSDGPSEEDAKSEMTHGRGFVIVLQRPILSSSMPSETLYEF